MEVVEATYRGLTSSEFSAAESFPLLLLFFMLLLADLLVSCLHRRKQDVILNGCLVQTLHQHSA